MLVYTIGLIDKNDERTPWMVGGYLLLEDGLDRKAEVGIIDQDINYLGEGNSLPLCATQALLMGISAAIAVQKKIGTEYVRFRSPSQLLINQINGEKGIVDKNLIESITEIQFLRRQFKKAIFQLTNLNDPWTYQLRNEIKTNISAMGVCISAIPTATKSAIEPILDTTNPGWSNPLMVKDKLFP